VQCPELLTAHVGAYTSRIRVGAAGIMLPNHAPLKVAEMFRTLLGMYPGRIDLALGRAPGTDPLTAHALRRGMVADAAAEFPAQVGELLAFSATDSLLAIPTLSLCRAAGGREARVVRAWLQSLRAAFRGGDGMSAVFAHHMSPTWRSRPAEIPPRVHATLGGRLALLGDVGAGLR